MRDMIRILYIDDYELDRELVKDALEIEHGGFEVVEASNRQEFEILLKAHRFDAVLSDFNIAGFDGFQVIEAVREYDPCLPVIIVTGTGSEEIAVRALKQGAADYVIKRPKHIQRLAQTILAAIEKQTLRDQRKNAETDLKKSEERFRNISENSLVGIYNIQDGILVYVNLKFAEIFGYSVEECLNNMPFRQLIHPEDFKIVQKQVLKQVSGEIKSVRYTVRGIKKGGEIIHVEIFESSIHLSGKLTITGTMLDITERKLAEETIRYSEKQYRSLFNSIRDAILVADTNRQIIDCNPAFIDLFGYSKRELLGKQTIAIYANEEEFKRMGSAIKDHIGDPEFLYTAHYQKENGSAFLGETNVFYMRDDENTIVGFIGLIRDITRSKRAEEEHEKLQEQFQQAQKMESVGRLAGGVAHDYNNALSVIIGFTELAMDGIDTAEPMHADLNEVLKAARRATDVTRQLLTFARKQTIKPKLLDLNETVENMLKMLRRLIGEDIDLICLLETERLIVKMDPSQIDQILANLCVNARDAIVGVGKVTIETKMVTFDTAYCTDHHGFVPGEFVMLAVSDNGCGIDKETLNHIFEPFFTTKNSDKGTGLGLATVYGIVNQNNGFINIYSEPGNGTAFKIYLPRHEGDIIKIQREDTEKISMGCGEMILIVEDDPSILKLAWQILVGLGYTVLTAGTPEGAISLAKKHTGRIHLLITDVIMPEMNGHELANTLQSDFPDLKCLFMSGYTADTIAHHGVLDEGVDFIQKPFSKRDLAAAIRKILDPAEKG